MPAPRPTTAAGAPPPSSETRSSPLAEEARLLLSTPPSTAPSPSARAAFRLLPTLLDLATRAVASAPLLAGTASLLAATLDARFALLGRTDSDGLRMEVAGGSPGAGLSVAARGALLDALDGLRPGRTDRLPASLRALLPGRPPAALAATFPRRGRRRGFLLLAGDVHLVETSETAEALELAAGIVGLAVGRLEARRLVSRLRRRGRSSGAPTPSEDGETIESRVREHAQELERAQHAALESERRLLDRERREGVDQLAAGVAHLLNNPLGALRANLEFADSLLREEEGARRLPGGDRAELRDALDDALEDARRMSGLVASAFEDAASRRLAVVRTDLQQAVEDAVQHFLELSAGRVAVLPELSRGLTVAVARGELTRWLFRVLSRLRVPDGGSIVLRTSLATDESPCIRIVARGGASEDADRAVSLVGPELDAASASLEVEAGESDPTLLFRLPRCLGEDGLSRREPR